MCLRVGDELGAEAGMICSALAFSKKNLGLMQLLKACAGNTGFSYIGNVMDVRKQCFQKLI